MDVSNSKKIAVIIQGPLITFGAGPNNTPQGFNTLSTILENIKLISDHGFACVLSTWTPKTEEEASILRQLQVAGLKTTVCDAPKAFDPDHRYKQRFGVMRGYEALDSGALDYFVKIRTDMLLPDSFWDFIKLQASEDDNILGVSHLFDTPFYIGDFVYFAKRSVFLDFMQAMLDYDGTVFHPAISFDDSFRLLHHKKLCNIHKSQQLFLNYLQIFYFQGDFYAKLWQDFRLVNIISIPKEIFSEILWRDKLMGSFSFMSSLRFDQGLIINKNNLVSTIMLFITDDFKYWRTARRKNFRCLFYKIIIKLSNLSKK